MGGHCTDTLELLSVHVTTLRGLLAGQGHLGWTPSSRGPTQGPPHFHFAICAMSWVRSHLCGPGGLLPAEGPLNRLLPSTRAHEGHGARGGVGCRCLWFALSPLSCEERSSHHGDSARAVTRLGHLEPGVSTQDLPGSGRTPSRTPAPSPAGLVAPSAAHPDRHSVSRVLCTRQGGAPRTAGLLDKAISKPFKPLLGTWWSMNKSAVPKPFPLPSPRWVSSKHSGQGRLKSWPAAPGSPVATRGGRGPSPGAPLRSRGSWRPSAADTICWQPGSLGADTRQLLISNHTLIKRSFCSPLSLPETGNINTAAVTGRYQRHRPHCHREIKADSEAAGPSGRQLVWGSGEPSAR